jgi:hypothetical protein
MLLRSGVERAGQLLGTSNVEKLRLHTERPRRSLRHAPLNRENRIAHVEEPRDSGELRKQLLEQLDAFGIDLDVVVAEPRDVSARAPEAGDEAAPTGSPLEAMTTGMVCVAFRAASAAGVPRVKIRSTFRLTSSLARAGNRSLRPSDDRYAMSTF